MVPGTTILGCSPGIGDRLSRCSRTLSNGSNTVVLICEVLANTVEMKTGSVVLEAVVEGYFDRVTPVCKESWARECSIDEENVSFYTIE